MWFPYLSGMRHIRRRASPCEGAIWRNLKKEDPALGLQAFACVQSYEPATQFTFELTIGIYTLDTSGLRDMQVIVHRIVEGS